MKKRNKEIYSLQKDKINLLGHSITHNLCVYVFICFKSRSINTSETFKTQKNTKLSYVPENVLINIQPKTIQKPLTVDNYRNKSKRLILISS